MDTRPTDTIRPTAGSRGKPGRRTYLAMLLVGAVAIVLGQVGSPSGDRPAPDGFRTRGGPAPLLRQEAMTGALRLERPACPVPARVSGDLRLLPSAVAGPGPAAR
jgi:hypothetical protein